MNPQRCLACPRSPGSPQGPRTPSRASRPRRDEDHPAEPARAYLRPPSVHKRGPPTPGRASRPRRDEDHPAEPARAYLRPPSVQADLKDPATMKRSHTILVVDDEKTIADGLRLTLESEGYGVRTAGSVREALGALVQGDSHAAIVNLM